ALPMPLFRHPPHKVLGYDTVGVYYVVGGLRRTDDPVDIGAQLITRVIPAGDTAPDVDGLVTDVHTVAETFPIKPFRYGMPPQTERLPIGIEHFRFAVVDIGIVRSGKYLGNGIGSVNLVTGIHKQHVITGSERQPFVHGVVNPIIGLTDELCNPTRILRDDVGRAVCRPTIDDHILDMWVGLVDDRTEGPLDIGRIV